MHPNQQRPTSRRSDPPSRPRVGTRLPEKEGGHPESPLACLELTAWRALRSFLRDQTTSFLLRQGVERPVGHCTGACVAGIGDDIEGVGQLG